ncbi:MAG: LacI family DNA-binding transcriptional regulator [Pseudomonadota bacterium]
MSSIEDVAAKAGVSVKTVSRVLSGFDGVRQQTRDRVEQAMRELEYYPSAAARSLRGKKIGTIGVIGDHLTTTPHAFDIVAGIQSECEKQDRVMMIGEMSGSKSAFNKLVERFRQQRADAIIFATDFMQDVKIDQSFSLCPLVLVNCRDREKDYPAVVPNDRAGGRIAASELLDLGHRRIAYLGLSEFIQATHERKKGYEAALRGAGVEIDPDLIRIGVKEGVPTDHKHEQNGNRAETDDEFEPLLDVLRDLFALAEPPTAIMCGNDKMAMRTYFLLRRFLDRDIPNDVSIVGYDDYRLISENLVPSLTTVLLPYFKMGAAAARLAVSDDLKPGVRKISGELIVRESTGAPVSS